MRPEPPKQVRSAQGVRLAVAAVAASALAFAAPSAAAAAPQTDLVARARTLYNQQKYDVAIETAEKARGVPASADAARLVLARARLERFRQSSDPQDLASARDALREIRPGGLSARDSTEYLVGLGEALYLEDSFGAAAEVFASVLDGSPGLIGALRERVLDWWASSADRATDQEEQAAREGRYARMTARIEDELASDPLSGVAIYWLAAAARGAGQLDRAWDAAVAGWVRASLTRDRGAALREDLDRLVLEGIIPGRARERTPAEAERARLASEMQAEWTETKQRWSGR